MLPLLLAGVIFCFLVLGAVVFVVCGTIPPLQRYALSAALWCAMWGPCVAAWVVVGGLGMLVVGVAMNVGHLRQFHVPPLPQGIGTGYIVAGLAGTLVVASAAAWVHQKLVRRMTFVLFRLYAGLVSAGVGSVWGWCLGIGLFLDFRLSYRLPMWMAGMTVLCAGFGYAGFRWAGRLRGGAPVEFTWVSKEEYEGTV